MGTSTDYGGGAGGAWTPAKYAATSFVKHGGRDRAVRALGLLVAAQGGAAAVANRSQAATSGAHRLGLFFSVAGNSGLDAALDTFGMADLVGSDAARVMEALIDLVGGPGEDHPGVAAREAACDVFEELAGDIDTYEDLADAIPDADRMRVLLRLFVASYVYRLLLPALSERFERLDDSSRAAARDKEVRQTVEAIVGRCFVDAEIDPLKWTSGAAEAEIDGLFREVLGYLEERGV